jgi:hypothetical protein
MVVNQLMPVAFVSILDLLLMKFLKLKFGLPSSEGFTRRETSQMLDVTLFLSVLCVFPNEE